MRLEKVKNVVQAGGRYIDYQHRENGDMERVTLTYSQQEARYHVHCIELTTEELLWETTHEHIDEAILSMLDTASLFDAHGARAWGDFVQWNG